MTDYDWIMGNIVLPLWLFGPFLFVAWLIMDITLMDGKRRRRK